MPRPVGELVRAAQELLQERWQELTVRAERGPLPDVVDDAELLAGIERCIDSRTKTFRYVLPTQLLAKAVDHSLDSRSIQVRYGGDGAFDARTIAHKVIVPFDRANHNVLGGSDEPYVSNPLRVPGIVPLDSRAKKSPAGWQDLCDILSSVETVGSPDYTNALLTQALICIHRRLEVVQVAYPVPIRISSAETIRLMEAFIAERSGGDRAQAIAAALLLVIGQRFGLFDSIRREAVNAADQSTGLIADLECISSDGEIVLVVEVKDKGLSIADIESKLQTVRARKVAEVLFIAQQGIAARDREQSADRLESHFAGGQNVYVLNLSELAKVAFALLGEQARPEFLRIVGSQLDDFKSDIRHRQAWRDLLAQT